MSEANIIESKVNREYTIMLTAQKLKEYRNSLQGVIIAPFHEENAKGVGYNLSPSELVYSLMKRTLLPVHYNDEGSYIWIEPHDTILTLSHEYLRIPENVSGVLHSRVRNVSQGLGNTATTLDPKWNGMLLLCLNNPTRRKIKLPIVKKADGSEHPCGLATMVLWETVGSEQKKNEQILQLDNPPMRADILSSLVSRPHRFWKSGQYTQLQELINKLMVFRTEDNEYIGQINRIIDQLADLRVAVSADKSWPGVTEAMIRLRELMSSNENEWGAQESELKSKFAELDKYMREMMLDAADISLEKKEGIIDEMISHMRRECEYLILCEKVNQIHTFIHRYTDEWWEKSIFRRVLVKYVMPFIPALIGTILLILLLMFGSIINVDTFGSKVIICLLPMLTSGLIAVFRKVIEKK